MATRSRTRGAPLASRTRPIVHPEPVTFIAERNTRLTAGAQAAELYVALHRGTPGDVAFYVRQCRAARSILELGCGDGRVLSQLWRPGRTLLGLDVDREMLRLAKRRAKPGAAFAWRLGDMASFRFRRRFDAILIPFSGFYCLSPRKKRTCLDAVAHHLSASGRLVLDAYDGEQLETEAGLLEPQVDDFEWMADVISGGVRYEVFERNAWWPSRRRLDVSYEYRPVTGEGARRGRVRHWYLSGDQAQALLAQHGFSSRRVQISRAVSTNEHFALVASLRK